MKLLLTLLFTFYGFKTLASPKCTEIFIQPTPVLKESLISDSVYKKMLQRRAKFSQDVQGVLKENAVVEILRDDAVPLLRENLIKLLKSTNDKTNTTELLSSLEKSLFNKVPARQVKERLQELLDKGDAQSLRRALGEKTLQETQELVYGLNPAQPSPESLMGQYLAESGALIAQRTYKAPPGTGESQTKTSIGIAPQQRELFYKYFVTLPELLFHYHTPRQGTLHILFDKKIITYAGGSQYPVNADLSIGSFNSFEDGTILPMVVLSTGEANKLINYFMLGGINQNFAKEPWAKLPNYCARGGYSSCTHWFGEMPVGETLVKSYVYPGRVDTHADYDVGKGPQKKALRPYENSDDYREILEQSSLSHVVWNPRLLQLRNIRPQQTDDHRKILDRLARVVWTVPGSQHFADMLGLQGPKLRGEFANPGYVVYNLIGRTSRQRVPFVFHDVGEKAKKIPQPLRIHAY